MALWSTLPPVRLTPAGRRFPACHTCLSWVPGESQMALGACVLVPSPKVRITLCSEVILRKSLNYLNSSSPPKQWALVYGCSKASLLLFVEFSEVCEGNLEENKDNF